MRHAPSEADRARAVQRMAWTLGAGLVGGVARTLRARHELIDLEAEIPTWWRSWRWSTGSDPSRACSATDEEPARLARLLGLSIEDIFEADGRPCGLRCGWT